jgi:predicted GNAT family N-acyltransferase
MNARAWLASTPEEKLAAYRLRYQVYVGEQNKNYPEADHVAMTLSDELDEEADLILIGTDDRVVGTVRGNYFDSRATCQRYAGYFEISRFSEVDPAHIAVGSRMASHPAYRHGVVRELLFESMYSRALVLRTELCLIACAPALRPLYERYGFREYLAPIHDAVVGPLHRMLLVLHDLEYLQRMSSPYARIALEHRVIACSHAARPALYRLLEDNTNRRRDESPRDHRTLPLRRRIW